MPARFKFLVVIVLIVVPMQLWAFSLRSTLNRISDPYADKLRPAIERIFGEKAANWIFTAKEKVVLPAIPKIKSDPTSVEIYDRKKEQGPPIKRDKEKSLKYNYAYVKEMIQEVRQSPASESEILQWVNVLEQGGGKESVYRAIVLDNTYAGLENYRTTPSDRSTGFALWLLERFVDQSYEQNVLKNLSLFSLKRLVTEKLLEIFDSFSSRNDQISWYAVLSAEIAQKYPSILKAKIRLNSSKEYQLQWANAVSEQDVKGELVIKIHKIFNSLK